MRTAWIAFAIANIVDAATFCGVSAARVAAAEQNPIARSLGGGLLSVVGAKGALLIVVLGGCWLLHRCDAPRWLPAVVAGTCAVLAFYGAWTNVAYGWA